MRKHIRLVISVVILAVLAWRTDWPQVQQTFARLDLLPWLTAVSLYLLSQVVSGLRWQLLAQPLGFRQSLARFTGIYFIGMYFNLLLPTAVGGDVVRAWYLNAGSGRRLHAFLTVFLDRFSGLLVLLALACLAVLASPIPVPSWVTGCVVLTVSSAVVGLLSVPLLMRWMRHRKRVHRAGQAMKLYFSRPRLLLATTGLSLIIQSINVIIVWLVGQALHAPVPASYYWIVVPMVTLLTMVPISLNGMGVREAGLIVFLAPLGVAESTALSLSFLWFAVYLTASLCGGLVYVFGHFPRPEVPSDDGLVSDHSDQRRTRQSPAIA
ncbi:MAG: lysylphosphatidylglycerol synthase transmembrane domain-containing protein [Gemmataceae bacterium]